MPPRGMNQSLAARPEGDARCRGPCRTGSRGRTRKPPALAAPPLRWNPWLSARDGRPGVRTSGECRRDRDPEMSHRLVGVDVGGTFTDLLYLDQAAGDVHLAKVPTTPDNQAFGVLGALDRAGVDLAALDLLVHGTTTTTNALLERKLATTGLITTRGFRDVLELGRRTRPKPYGLTGWFEPLVPRELRLEVLERMDAEGRVVVPLDEDAVGEAARELLALGCESVVIHFLHAYRNPEHERRARSASWPALWPNDHVTAGHEILSEFREYERGTAAAVNACVQPILARYLSRLVEELASARSYRQRRAGHAGKRRHRVGAGGGGYRCEYGHVRPGVRSDGRRLDGRARRVRERDHLRHGRHELRRGARPGRRARGELRARGGACGAHPRADGGRAHHRCGRRLHRLRQRGGAAAGGAGKRGRGTRTHLLRARRGAGHHHRRQPAARAAQSEHAALGGEAGPARLDRVPVRRADRNAARARRGGSGGGGAAHRQRPHGGGAADGVAVPWPRPARLRAVRVRRRGSAARGGTRPRARHPPGHRPRPARNHERAGVHGRGPAP